MSRTGRLLGKAFNDALADAGGSLPQWLVLTALKRGDHTMQRKLAAAIGIEGATLTHHLNRMEADGFVRRERVAGNRRNQPVALMPAGEAVFTSLLAAAITFDAKLRSGVTGEQLSVVQSVLARLRATPCRTVDR